MALVSALGNLYGQHRGRSDSRYVRQGNNRPIYSLGHHAKNNRSTDSSTSSYRVSVFAPRIAWNPFRHQGLGPETLGILLVADDAMVVQTLSDGPVLHSFLISQTTTPSHWSAFDGRSQDPGAPRR